MDSRKIQFLINIQKEIDKLEKDSLEAKRLEKLKSKFYDLVDGKNIKEKNKNLHHQKEDIKKEEDILKNKSLEKNAVLNGTEKQPLNDAFGKYVKGDIIVKSIGNLDDLIAKKQKQKKSLVNLNDGEDKTKIVNDDGFISISTDNIEVTVKDKRKHVKKFIINLNHHKPREISAFLAFFSSQSHPLKYLLHDFNVPGELFIYKEFIKNITNSFYNETKKHTIPPALYARIKAFIGIESSKKWSFKGKYSNFNLYSEQVKIWSEKNPNRHPILEFSDEFRFFRESIKIENNLEEIINFALAEKNLLSKIIITPENIKTAYFFTDVDALIKALGTIFNSIAQRIEESNEIKISFSAETKRELGRLRIIKIVHLSSKSDKELDENILFGGDSNGGDFKGIKRILYKVCDWSIMAENPNKNVNKLNILYNPQTGIKPKEHIDEPIEGFTHILTFYS